MSRHSLWLRSVTHGNFGKLGVLLLGERRRDAARALRVDRASLGRIQAGVQMVLTFAFADTVLVVLRARVREFDPDATSPRRIFFVANIRHSAGCVGAVQVQALGSFRQGVFVNVGLDTVSFIVLGMNAKVALTLVKVLSWVVSSLSGSSLCSSTSSDWVTFWTQLRQRYTVSFLSRPGKKQERRQTAVS